MSFWCHKIVDKTLYPNFESQFYDFVTLSQFCYNSVVAKISQPINHCYVDLNQDLNQSRCNVTELAAHSAARQSSTSATANGYQCNQ